RSNSRVARYLRYGDVGHRDVHSFPTRRSSDLRNDFQIKLRGHRIELGEIESVLSDHPAVTQALVVAADGPASDGRYLAAYYVLEDRKSTRLNSSHVKISYAVFCLKKKSPDRPA